MLSYVAGRVGVVVGSERSGCPIFIFFIKEIKKIVFAP